MHASERQNPGQKHCGNRNLHIIYIAAGTVDDMAQKTDPTSYTEICF